MGYYKDKEVLPDIENWEARPLAPADKADRQNVPLEKIEDILFDPTSLDSLSPREKFILVRQIIEELEYLSPASPDDPEEPIDENIYGIYIEALTIISNSISYSEIYYKLSESLYDRVCFSVEGDVALREKIGDWYKIGDKQQTTIPALVNHFSAAVHELTGQPLQEIGIETFWEPKKVYPSQTLILLGRYKSTQPMPLKGLIKINEHDDAEPFDAHKLIDTVFHELQHAFQDFLGYHARTDLITHFDIEHDGLLWRQLGIQRARINSSRLRKPYMAQFYERPAWEMGHRFSQTMLDLSI